MDCNIPLLGDDGMAPPMDMAAEYKKIKELLKNSFPSSCSKFSQYSVISMLSHSHDSYVVKAEDIDSGEEYVLKKVKYPKNSLFGYPRNSVLESTILMQLKHDNIIAMEGYAIGRSMFKNYLVLEYCKEDLTQFLKSYSELEQCEIKCILQMLLKGLMYLHDNLIMHRDISPDNLFIHASGMLKIGDFGKARYSEKNVVDEIDSEMCNHDIGTPGYRAPELILNHSDYYYPVDVWSFGCIFGELLIHKPVFRKSKCEDWQLNDIIKLCGAPNVEYVQKFRNHYLFRNNVLSNQSEDTFNTVFASTCIEGVQLLRKCLCYDWNERIKSEDCLHEKYFEMKPFALNPENLLLHLCRKRVMMQENPDATDLGGTSSAVMYGPIIPASNTVLMNIPSTSALSANESKRQRTSENNGDTLSEGEIPDSPGE